MLWLIFLGLGSGVLGALSLAGLFVYYGLDPNLPRIASVHEYRPKKVTRIFDRKARLIGEISVERRTVVPYDIIPKLLVQAVIAAEDAEFFHHRGLDYVGMLRAFLANLRAGRFVQGGSTITQQLVKTFFLSPERTIRRKVQEVLLARRLENELSKQEILYLYLNQIYFGHGRYGVEEASRFYFGNSVAQLSLAECALLAGLPNSPERMSPLKHPERAKQRQMYVLRRMAELSFISSQVARSVMQDPIRVVRRKHGYYNVSPELNDLVRERLARQYGEQRLATLGAQVHTTLDADMQLAAREALQWGLRAIDARQGYRLPLRRLTGNNLKQHLRRLKRTQRKLVAGHSYEAVVQRVHADTDNIDVSLGSRVATVNVDDERYNPQSHSVTKRFGIGDLIRVRLLPDDHFVFDPGPQGALIALDTHTGGVLAMVGGYDFKATGFNRALQANRQPGSAFKPVVYAAALASGRYTPATIVDDAPAVFKGWKPQNFEGMYRGPVRLRTALAHSINTVAVRLIDDVGVSAVRHLATAMGITSQLGDDLSLALGSYAVRPIDLAAAYACISNGGQHVAPRFIEQINQEAPTDTGSQKQVLDPAVAYVLTDMMRSVVREGTARRALQLRRPVAGKTGTTNEQKDAWFVGFTPRLVAAVWVGFDKPRPLGRGETGGRAALPIWIRFMRAALRNRPKLPFTQPPGVTVESIDPQTGLLAAAGATDALQEVFVAGTEPKQRAVAPDEVDPSTILMAPTVP